MSKEWKHFVGDLLCSFHILLVTVLSDICLGDSGAEAYGDAINVRWFQLNLLRAYLDLGPPVPLGASGDEKSPSLTVTGDPVGSMPAVTHVF